MADEDWDRRLTNAVYDTVGVPQRLPNLLEELQNFIGSQDSNGANDGFGEHLPLAARLPHIAELLDKLNAATPVAEDYVVLETDDRCLFDLDDAGRVVFANAVAKQNLGVRLGRPIDEAALLPANIGLIRAAKQRVFAGLAIDGFRLLSDVSYHDGSPVVLMLHRTLAPAGNVVCRVREVALQWRDDVADQFRVAFGLTQTESALLELVVKGENLADHADATNRSVQTRRTQMKQLLRKTGTHSQQELLRLYAASCALAPLPILCQGASSKDVSFVGSMRRNGSHVVPLENGRVAVVEITGPSSGHPVVLLHGFTSGLMLTEQSQTALERHNMRLFAPWRAGFGKSDAIIGDLDAQLAGAARDLAAFLDWAGLERVSLMAWTSAMPFAAYAASELGERVEAIFGVNCFVPIRSKAQIDSMKGWQKIYAGCARYFPAMLPVLVKGAMQFVANHMPEKLIAGLHPPESPDYEHALDPEVRELLIGAYRASFAQGTRAYEIDARLNADDRFARIMANIQHRCVYIFGEQDTVTAPAEVKLYSEENAKIEIRPIAGCGHLAWYSDLESILKIMK